MIDLRQSTASQEVVIGPFVDATDGNTEETGLTIANTDIKIWKSGATTFADKASGGATHIANGRYYMVLDASDTNTIGCGEIYVHVAGALYCKTAFRVLDEAVFDVLYGTTAPSTLAAGALMGLADDAITAAKLAADAGTEIAAAVWAAAARTLTAGTNIALAKGVGLTGLNDIAATDVWAAVARTLTAGTNIALAKGVGLTGLNDLSAADVNAQADLAISDAALATAAALATVDGIVDGIKLKTDLIPTDPADESLLEAAIATRAAAGDAMALTSRERTALGAALGARQVGAVAAATQDRILLSILAALLAKTSGGGTASIVLRNLADSANLATVTVDENDNRTAVTLTWANA